MASSPTVTLFTEQFDSSGGPVSIIASAVAHVAVIALVAFGVIYSPKIVTRPVDPSLFRHIDLLAPLPKPHRTPKGIVYRGSASPAPDKKSPHPPMLQKTVKAQLGPQTILQPDLERNLALKQQIPVPEALIWQQRTKVVQNIVAPQPAAPPVAQAKPSFDAPNHEINISDVNITSSLATQQLVNIQPSSTSPVVSHAEISIQQPPSDVTQVSMETTPVAIFSLSNMHMNGIATLPSVNESARADADGKLSPSDSGGGKGTGSGSGNSAGKGAGQSGLANGAGREGQPNGTGAGDDTDITLPHDGEFGSVVVGNTLQDEFPELSGVWNGRIAYTVYLHVGLARSWILQYSLPNSARIAISAKGDHIEAPWPYSIVRPNLAPGAINADALLVHGYVDGSGRFENLSIAFPENFAQAQFVLDALQRWQFRPATENGQSARVEVLLIIPESFQ